MNKPQEKNTVNEVLSFMKKQKAIDPVPAPQEKKIETPANPVVEIKKETPEKNNLMLEVLKRNNQQLHEISTKVNKIADKGSKFKFDIIRNDDGYISQVIVEKV